MNIKPSKATHKTVAFGLTIVSLLILWQFCPIAVIPKPLAVVDGWIYLLNYESMLNQLCTSLIVNIQSIGLAVIISLALAYSTLLPGNISLFTKPLVNLITKLRFSSLTGLIFIFTLMFGIGHALKVSLVTYGITGFYLTSMVSIVADIPKEEFDHARTLRYNEWQVLWEVVILGRLDYAIEALLQNAAMGLSMLTMVEGLSRGEGGIGKLMLDQNKHFILANLIALQITIITTGLVQDKLFKLAKAKWFPYSELGKEQR